jgi:hypothetical protein
VSGRPCLGLVCVALLASACTSGTSTGWPTAGVSAIPTAAIASPVSTPTMPATPTPAPTAAPTPFVPYTLDEPTRYEGTLKYDCEEDGCWRMGSKIVSPSTHYYPDPDANNAEIAALLNDIGLGTTRIDDDATAWQRMRALWAWLHEHAADMTAAPEAWNYLLSIANNAKPEHWPSISDLASTWARYHVIPWGACNSRALTAGTLAYRLGFSPDRLAGAWFMAPGGKPQHFYVVLRSGSHWLYVDPTCNSSSASLPAEPASVGCVDAVDYEHPLSLALLPGSTLTRVMLVR